MTLIVHMRKRCFTCRLQGLEDAFSNNNVGRLYDGEGAILNERHALLTGAICDNRVHLLLRQIPSTCLDRTVWVFAAEQRKQPSNQR